MHQCINTEEQNQQVVEEIIARGQGCRSWLIFCSGVKHAERIAELLRLRGIAAEHVEGNFSRERRDSVLRRFKSSELQAITNVNVLTTGFDHPDIDLVAFLRPTESPTVCVQMAGRGMRLKSHTDHCRVLDFAGLVERHGTVDDLQSPRKKGEGTAEAPIKVCPECGEKVHDAART